MKREAVDTSFKHLIDLRDVSKVYETAAGSFSALRGISLRVGHGEFVTVIGKSGSGKSTLLNMVTGIDRQTSGEILVAGTRINDLNESQLAGWRGKRIGIVFQFFQLLPTLTVIENVMLPMDFCGVYPRAERPRRAMSLLEKIGMAD